MNKRSVAITLRVTEEELQNIRKAAEKLWPNTPSFSLSAKVRELLRQRVQQILKNER